MDWWFWTISSFSRLAPPLAYAVSVAFLIPVSYFEWELYRYLWPSEDEVLQAEACRVRGDADSPPTARKVPKPNGPRHSSLDEPTASGGGVAGSHAGGQDSTPAPPVGDSPEGDADRPASEEA